MKTAMAMGTAMKRAFRAIEDAELGAPDLRGRGVLVDAGAAANLGAVDSHSFG